MSRIPAKEIKAKANIVEVIQRYIDLKKEGANYKACCPFHGENTPSFVVNPVKQIYKCFGCGRAGDVIDFVVGLGRTFKEALSEIEDPYNLQGKPLTNDIIKAYKPAPVIEWKPLIVSSDFKEPKFTHYTHGKPVKVWTFKNDIGQIVGYTCRFETKSKSKKDKIEKVVLPYCYATNGTISEWRWLGFGKPRPVYNLDLLKPYPDLPVMISEGEKTADAIHGLVPEHISITWIGGANGVKNTDWTPLKGRKVILWPDNDQPGFKAMLEIAAILKELGCEISWIKPTEDQPKGFDAADAKWTIEQCAEFLAKQTGPVPAAEDIIEAEDDTPKELTLVRGGGDGENTEGRKYIPHDKSKNGHFRMLGYEKSDGLNVYHFYSYGSKSIISLVPSQMGKSNLLLLAPLYWWEMEFPAMKMVFDQDEAQDFLITYSNRIGIFNEKWIRGRGAWIDEKRVVIHCGNKLIVDGVETPLSNFVSKYIYEIGEEMGFENIKYLTKEKAANLLDLNKMLNWQRDVDAYLLAGWCVIAPVCGALNWRPHGWLTGSAGSGKSVIIEKIVKPCLGPSVLSVQGETSEAGLRQTLKHDALPVVFDEAEGNDNRSQMRMQDVLSLMRSASTADGGLMAKGSAGGTAKTYKIRSCFLFASINNQVSNQADRSRITLLSLMSPRSNDQKAQAAAREKYNLFLKKYSSFFSEDYCAALRARTVSLLPVILKNAQTFSNAAAAEFGDQRAGDQVGALLAGAWSLVSNKYISYDDARKWVADKDWNEEKGQDTTRDELACISHIMDQFTRLESASGMQERNVGELVQICAKMTMDITLLVTETTAELRLKRDGIKVSQDLQYVIISNTSFQIKKWLKDTPWVKNHNKTLERIPGAVKCESERFGGGTKTRAVKIPIKALFTDKAEN